MNQRNQNIDKETERRKELEQKGLIRTIHDPSKRSQSPSQANQADNTIPRLIIGLILLITIVVSASYILQSKIAVNDGTRILVTESPYNIKVYEGGGYVFSMGTITSYPYENTVFLGEFGPDHHPQQDFPSPKAIFNDGYILPFDVMISYTMPTNNVEIEEIHKIGVKYIEREIAYVVKRAFFNASDNLSSTQFLNNVGAFTRNVYTLIEEATMSNEQYTQKRNAAIQKAIKEVSITKTAQEIAADSNGFNKIITKRVEELTKRHDTMNLHVNLLQPQTIRFDKNDFIPHLPNQE